MAISSLFQPGHLLRANWFAGLLAVAAVRALELGTGLTDALERHLYDLASSNTVQQMSNQIAVIAIDDQSIARIGPWPWSRDLHARMIDQLAAAKASTIVYSSLFFEPQVDRGLAFIRQIKRLVVATDATGVGPPGNANLTALIAQAENTLDADGQLALSLKNAGNVILPSVFVMGQAHGKPDAPLPAFAIQSAIDEATGFSIAAIRSQQPMGSLGAAAAGVGHLNQVPDPDGVVRREALLVNYAGKAVPSMALLAVVKSLNLKTADIRLNAGQSVQVDKLRLRTDASARLLPRLYKGPGGEPAFSVHSFSDVLSGKIPASQYAGKIVVIGTTAAGVGTPLAVPGNPAMSLAERIAQVTASILNQDFIVQPGWAAWATWGVFLLVAAYVVAALPRLPVGLATLATFLLFAALLGAEFSLLSGAALWLKLVLPATLLPAGYLALMSQRSFLTRPVTTTSSEVPNDAKLKHGMAMQGPAQPCQARIPVAIRTPVGSAVEKSTLGRYQLEKELGKGAMGVVYLGQDPRIGRVVAIKTMALGNEFEGRELVNARERFFREAETAGRLQHQNIVTIFDVGEEHDLAYIAMEFLKGKDLVEFCKSSQLLPVPSVLSIVARVADALAYAHRQHVVHRDIKPANVMYESESDTVKVTDFGIARITDSSKTKTGLVLGTPSFMSPEQLAGKKIDGRSDLYSLAVMLFQLLTGVLPFRGQSMAELMTRITNDEAPDIRTIRPDLSASLAHLIARALGKLPETRYPDGDQLARQLRAILIELKGGAALADTISAMAPDESNRSGISAMDIEI